MNILDLLKSLLSLSLGDFIRRNFGTGPGTELLIDVGGVFLLSTFCLLIVILAWVLISCLLLSRQVVPT